MEPFLQSAELRRGRHVVTQAAQLRHAVVLSMWLFWRRAKAEYESLDHVHIQLITHYRIKHKLT